ncbi:hypothetical protein I5Q34_07445 [Streptomyces sp. AV19]|uniref:hypothetical protein n=1 Tax=Streptomyces sp. AV19 TaxID=2793068 RepID=UPI0018FEB725|nr:hypothetical protein [Streptomyces sp. AV19]MBH1934130.1 hypothetical protein [Streptomyces sp. AV19]MDG4537148.1 hypothetical protein [Streptomyces sp. AV19]
MSDQRMTDELYDPITQAIAEALRLAITIAAVVADEIARAREERYRREEAASQERARALAERLRAERSAVEPLLREAWQERFWRTPDARRLGRCWQAAAEWAGGDEFARQTLEHLRQQLNKRYGIEAPAWPLHGAEISRMIALAAPEFQRFLQQGRAAAHGVSTVSLVVLIRDTADPLTIAHQDVVVVAAGMPPSEAGANAFLRWAEQARSQNTDLDVSRFYIEVLENTADGVQQVPAARLYGHEAERARQEAVRWQRAVVSGEQEATPAELLYALEQERGRLEAEKEHRVSRFREYRSRLDAEGLSDADRKRLAGNITAIIDGLPVLRQQIEELQLRIEVAGAQVRGEDPAHVYGGVQLRDLLDQGWWETANDSEIAGVWDTVRGWSPGQARAEMQAHLREEINKHHGVHVPPGDKLTGVDIAQLLGESTRVDEAITVSLVSEELRDEGLAAYEEAAGLHAQAKEKDAAAEQTPDAEEGASLRAEAASLQQHAMEVKGRAEAMMDRSAWVSAQGVAAEFAVLHSGNARAVERLTEEFARRWARTPAPEAIRQFLAETERGFAPTGSQTVLTAVPLNEERTVWRALRPTSGAVPQAGPEAERAPETAVSVRETAETERATAEAERAAREMRDARQAAAEVALKDMPDQEAAEAARLAAMAFPEGPEAAVAKAPVGSRKSGSAGPSASRERAAELGR